MRWVAVIAAVMGVLACGDLAYIQFKITSFDRATNKGIIFATPTVPTFAYNNVRSGTIKSSLTTANYTPLTVHELPFSKGNSHTMPVYLNGSQTQLPGLAGRKLIYFGTSGHFTAYDIEKNSIVWSKELPLPHLAQAPVIDVKRGKVYFTASGLQEGKSAASPAAEKVLLQLLSVNLDGSELRSQNVDLDKLIYPGQPDQEIRPSTAVRCKTSLGLNDHARAHYVFWGCGMEDRLGPHHYGNLRGARGVLIAAYLDDSGEMLGPNAFATYSPSPITADPRTGFDTGIWNSGAGPGLLSDNVLLLATGNGPFFPTQGNYGCSVVSLDGERLIPRAGKNGGQDFYSLDDQGYNECHVSNMEFGSSSVASIETGGRVYSAVAGKDGHLRVFDPYELPGDDPGKKSKVLIGRQIFGQPNLLLDLNDEVQVVAGGGKLSYPFHREGSDYVTATQAQSEFLEGQGYQRRVCLGLISKHKKAKRLELVLHFSGPLRHDYVTLPMGTTIQAMLSRGEFAYADWTEAVAANQTGKAGPYTRLQNVGYTLDRDFDKAPPGYTLTALKLYASKHGGLYSAPEALLSRSAARFNSSLREVFKGQLLKGRSGFPDEYGSILLANSRDHGGYCGTNEDSQYDRLYLFALPAKKDPTGWAITSFNVSDRYELTKKWIHLRNDGTTYPHSSMVTTFSETGDPGLVIFPIEDSDSSYLVLLNSETGELVDQIGFSGRARFTMPLVVDERIYLATSDGIKVFKRSDSYSELARRISFWRNL